MSDTKASRVLSDRQLLILGAMVDRRLVYTGTDLGYGAFVKASMGGFVDMETGKLLAKGSELGLNFAIAMADMAALNSRLGGASLAKLTAYLENKGLPVPRLENGTAKPCFPNDLGKTTVAEERERLERLRAEIIAMEENPRLVVAKRFERGTVRGAYDWEAVPGVGELYVVAGETAKNWRVRAWYEETETSHGKVKVDKTGYYALEKADVFAIDVTVEQYAAMRAATDSYVETVSKARVEAKAEIEALTAPVENRLAMYERQLLGWLQHGIEEALSDENETPPPTP